jgi:hypothetical protein
MLLFQHDYRLQGVPTIPPPDDALFYHKLQRDVAKPRERMLVLKRTPMQAGARAGDVVEPASRRSYSAAWARGQFDQGDHVGLDVVRDFWAKRTFRRL